MLDWKRVDTLVKASVALLQQGEKLHLRLIGYGPEEARLRRLAGKLACRQRRPGQEFLFRAPVEIGAIRGIMRQSDVYVLSSDGGEGWGAVVNEAMAEGCTVIGTHEAGSSATMIEHGVNGWAFSSRQCPETEGMPPERNSAQAARRTESIGSSRCQDIV
jgi:glycosyltransferase involved in cell wall biosynthesis